MTEFMSTTDKMLEGKMGKREYHRKEIVIFSEEHEK